MKAAVFHGRGDIRIEDVPDPVLTPAGIIIKIRLCGICGSDLHPRDTWDAASGMILGHEFSGDVVAVGAEVSGIAVGDRVAALGYEKCGACSSCRQGMPQHCTARKYVGYEFPGGFAEYVSIPVAIPKMTVFPLPDAMSYEEGATLEPLAIAVHAVRKAEPTAVDTVLVLGAGMIGQCVMQVCKAMGVAKVIVSEVGRKRLAVAAVSGADTVIDAMEGNIGERVREATGGNGPEIVFECAGASATFHDAVGLVRDGGRVMLVGIPATPITWDPFDLIRKNLKMIGCLGGSFPRAIDLIFAGKVSTKGLVTHIFPLERAREAFALQRNADETVKVLIKP